MVEPISSQEKSPSVFESDLKRIEGQINKFKELPEAESMAPQEIVRQSVKQIAPLVGDVSAPVPAQPMNPPDEAEKTVEYLVNMAITEGVVKANQAAKDAEPFVMDSFHDAMVGRFYPELQKRGIID
jgi:hypothetical protein